MKKHVVAGVEGELEHGGLDIVPQPPLRLGDGLLRLSPHCCSQLQKARFNNKLFFQGIVWVIAIATHFSCSQFVYLG